MPLTTTTATSGCSAEMRPSSSSPERCGMVRSSSTTPTSSPARISMTRRGSSQVMIRRSPAVRSRVSESDRSQAGSSSTSSTPNAG